MQAVFQPAPVTGSPVMYEQLLARGNRQVLVTIHRGEITKIAPVKQAEVCARVARPPGGLVDNGAMLSKLLKKPYGQYLVTVCWGKIAEVLEVDRENEVKSQSLDKLALKSKKRPGQ